MSKVDWAEAEVLYIANPKMSHGRLAKRYGVAKSTITRYAVSHGWQAQRDSWQEKRAKRLRKISYQHQNEIDEKHLKNLQLIQTVIHNDFMRIAIKQQEGEEVTHQEMQRLFGHVKPMIKAVMAERAILGLPTKLTQIRDPQQIIDYVRAMNGPTPQQKREEMRETEITLEKLIEHKKRIQALRNSE